MAKDETHRIRPEQIQADKDAMAAIITMTGYAPANSDCSLVNLQASATSMQSAQNVEVQKKGEADAARDAACAAEWTFHDLMLLAKDQVKAQFGPDSDQLQALGLTKASERKKPAARPAKPATP